MPCLRIYQRTTGIPGGVCRTQKEIGFGCQVSGVRVDQQLHIGAGHRAHRDLVGTLAGPSEIQIMDARRYALCPMPITDT